MNLCQLVEMFRHGGAASEWRWWHSNTWRSMFGSEYGYQDGQPVFESAVQSIVNLNPTMLSEDYVRHTLRFGFLSPQTVAIHEHDHLSGDELKKEARLHVTRLADYEQWRDVDIAMAYMHLGDKPFSLGRVSFVKVTPDELKEWKKQSHWPDAERRVQVTARVVSPGDEQRALAYAQQEVGTALDVLRAFTFPFGKRSDQWLAGPVGELDASRLTPVRIDGKKFLTMLGPGIATFSFETDLSALESREWAMLSALILKDRQARPQMEQKLTDALHWLAEATKPDTNNSKFIKVAIALETMLGREAKDEDLKVRSITAMLAERAAFVAGACLDDRLEIDSEIRRHLGMRGAIVHEGGKGDAPLDDIDSFGGLARRIAVALLHKLDELGDTIATVAKLEDWVKQQKYTLPVNGGAT